MGIDLRNSGITDSDISELIRLIHSAPAIVSLDLSYNYITNQSTKLLSNLQIKHLMVGHTHIRDLGAIDLLSSPFFITLYLNNCALSEAVEPAILKNGRLTELEVSYNDKISLASKTRIVEHIKSNKMQAQAINSAVPEKSLEQWEAKESSFSKQAKNTKFPSRLVDDFSKIKPEEKENDIEKTKDSSSKVGKIFGSSHE